MNKIPAENEDKIQKCDDCLVGLMHGDNGDHRIRESDDRYCDTTFNFCPECGRIIAKNVSLNGCGNDTDG